MKTVAIVIMVLAGLDALRRGLRAASRVDILIVGLEGAVIGFIAVGPTASVFERVLGAGRGGTLFAVMLAIGRYRPGEGTGSDNPNHSAPAPRAGQAASSGTSRFRRGDLVRHLPSGDLGRVVEPHDEDGNTQLYLEGSGARIVSPRDRDHYERVMEQDGGEAEA